MVISLLPGTAAEWREDPGFYSSEIIHFAPIKGVGLPNQPCARQDENTIVHTHSKKADCLSKSHRFDRLPIIEVQ